MHTQARQQDSACDDLLFQASCVVVRQQNHCQDTSASSDTRRRQGINSTIEQFIWQRIFLFMTVSCTCGHAESQYKKDQRTCQLEGRHRYFHSFKQMLTNTYEKKQNPKS